MYSLLKAVADLAAKGARLVLLVFVFLSMLMMMLASILLESGEYDESDFEYIEVDGPDDEG